MLATYHLGLHIENLQPQAEVRWNPEEGLAHDDERRDIEKRVGGKIMKIDPIVIHDSTYKWVEGKPEPTDKMGKEHDSLVRLRSRDNLSRRWETVANLLGQIPGFSEPLDILLPDGKGHPFASRSGSGHLIKTPLQWRRRALGR